MESSPRAREWTKRAEELVKTAQRLAAGRSFDQASEELKQVEAEYQKPQRWWDNVREALASIRKNNELLNKKLSQLPDSSQTLTGWTEKLTASVEAKLLRDDGADGLAEARIIDEWMSKIDPLIQLRRKLTQTKMASRTFAGIPELKQTFEEVDQLVQEADNSLVQARLSDARHLYERAAERSSKATTLAAAHLSRLLDEGNKWLKTKSFDKAVAQFEQLIALRPQGPGAPELPEKGVALQLGSVLAQAYAGRAEAYIGQHDNDRAITDCAEALGLDPNLAQAYATRATAHCQMGVFDKAIADSEKALRINPKLTSAYTASAMAYSGKYNFDRAIANCNEAIRIQPEDVLALQVRGARLQRALRVRQGGSRLHRGHPIQARRRQILCNPIACLVRKRKRPRGPRRCRRGDPARPAITRGFSLPGEGLVRSEGLRPCDWRLRRGRSARC